MDKGRGREKPMAKRRSGSFSAKTVYRIFMDPSSRSCFGRIVTFSCSGANRKPVWPHSRGRRSTKASSKGEHPRFSAGSSARKRARSGSGSPVTTVSRDARRPRGVEEPEPELRGPFERPTGRFRFRPGRVRAKRSSSLRRRCSCRRRDHVRRRGGFSPSASGATRRGIRLHASSAGLASHSLAGSTRSLSTHSPRGCSTGSVSLYRTSGGRMLGTVSSSRSAATTRTSYDKKIPTDTILHPSKCVSRDHYLPSIHPITLSFMGGGSIDSDTKEDLFVRFL